MMMPDRRKKQRYHPMQNKAAFISSHESGQEADVRRVCVHDYSESGVGLQIEDGCISNCADGDCGLIGSPIEVRLDDSDRFFTGYIRTCHGGRIGVEFGDDIIANKLTRVPPAEEPHPLILHLLAKRQESQGLSDELGIHPIFWRALVTGERQPNCLGTYALRKMAAVLEVPYVEILVMLGVLNQHDVRQALTGLFDPSVLQLQAA